MIYTAKHHHRPTIVLATVLSVLNPHSSQMSKNSGFQNWSINQLGELQDTSSGVDQSIVSHLILESRRVWICSARLRRTPLWSGAANVEWTAVIGTIRYDPRVFGQAWFGLRRADEG